MFFEKIGVKDVCAGQFHTLALTVDNELYSWGKGQYGRLGHNNTDTSGTPQRVMFTESGANNTSTNQV